MTIRVFQNPAESMGGIDLRCPTSVKGLQEYHAIARCANMLLLDAIVIAGLNTAVV